MQSTLVNPNMTVIRPNGSINGANALEFERKLTTLLTQGDCSILLLDLGKVESIDSAAVLALVSVLKLSQNMGRRFSLCSVSPALKMIFELTQLDRLFEIYEDESAFTNA
ncbi:anti-sigma factor antagonist [Scytonema sp. UIC 10036]|uniref:STAS domain-containing protein n=1 Tax=Scytonema sp. UIC 10036 TaxID=2304196 RepID=UPI0012DA796B|nr:STAS domain-containing protein [Scytonema sp. UIC 10036]MUG94005.1 anti-sigma factor antagonist [Scytonema sp. UIC 10036]